MTPTNLKFQRAEQQRINVQVWVEIKRRQLEIPNMSEQLLENLGELFPSNFIFVFRCNGRLGVKLYSQRH